MAVLELDQRREKLSGVCRDPPEREMAERGKVCLALCGGDLSWCVRVGRYVGCSHEGLGPTESVGVEDGCAGLW